MNQLIKAAQELTLKGDEFIKEKGPLKFHEKAHELLERARLHKLYNFEELVESSFKEDFSSFQNYSSFQFSDLPLTLSSGKECFVDLYFWRRRPTVIHDHHFTGAFQCLEGENVDLEFSYTKQKSLGRWHDLGEIKKIKSRKIVKGDIAPIDLLDKFIHQNHHQADLTINVCFRTPDIGETNLSNYLYSGLRFEKSPELLARVDRLMSFINLGEFDYRKLDIKLDDAINFLLRSYHSNSGSQKFAEIKSFMEEIVQGQGELNLANMLAQHEKIMDQLESEYN